MQFDSAIFDLDGTLWNCCQGVARGWNKALVELGINRIVTASEIAGVCGKPQIDCVRTVLPEIPKEKFDEFFTVINREEEISVRTYGGELYRGVAEGLQKLRANLPVFIVSNCTEWYLDGFLNQFAFHNTFKDVECHGRTGHPKGKNLRDLIHRNDLKNPVYVGDTTGDQAAAEEAGAAFLFAAYGFGKVPGVKQFNSFNEIVSEILV